MLRISNCTVPGVGVGIGVGVSKMFKFYVKVFMGYALAGELFCPMTGLVAFDFVNE